MKIDIIIPAYKAQKTLWKTLLSITMQSYKDECLITVVNDDNIKNDDYNNIIDKFKTVLNVRLINTPCNLGAAQAREFGIKHTWLPYMIFLDSDDVLANQLSIFNQSDGDNVFQLTSPNQFKLSCLTFDFRYVYN